MPSPTHPLRLLVVLPSWVGDAVMATPALRLLREALPGSSIGGLMRPGIDQVLGGLGSLDEIHVFRPHGVMAPKRAANLVRPRRYDAALLLTNSFSTALITRLAFIGRRVGYDRDGRGVLLTQKVRAPRRADGSWAIVPAVTYYHHAASALLDPGTPPLEAPALDRPDRVDLGLPAGTRMELACTERDEAAAADLFTRAHLDPGEPYAVLNPGGNNPAKRWAVERFAAIGDHLASTHGVRVFVAGSPAETDLGRAIAERASCAVAVLPDLGLTLGGLKAILARARVLVTNDTGPRHIAAAFGTPVVSLFGPTDARWTTIPFERETVVVADPTLPADQSANDHPDRCSIDRIEVARVIEAVDGLLAGA